MGKRQAAVSGANAKAAGRHAGVIVTLIRHSEGGVGAAPGAAELIAAVRSGIPAAEFDALQGALDVPRATLAKLIGISKATLNRRKPTDLLGVVEGDRVVRFASLYAQARRVMGSQSEARAWLNRPQVGLGGNKPMDHALTEVGAREVEDLLGRIEHGVYA